MKDYAVILSIIRCSFTTAAGNDSYSTRLRNWEWAIGHDDWDCLEDLEAAGFVWIISLINGFVRMTDLGAEVVQKLRNHKHNGGVFGNFVL